MEQLGSNCADFHDTLCLSLFPNMLRKHVSLKSDKNNRHFAWGFFKFMAISCWIFKWEMFRTTVVEKIKIHISYLITFFFFFRKSCRLCDNVKKMWWSQTGHRWRNGWMPVSCERCVLFGRGLCDGPITRPEEFYRLWCVTVGDPETSRMRKHWPALGCCTRRATTTFLREAEDLQRWDMQLQQQIYNLGTRMHTHTHICVCLAE
jgi:hypothetical protein